MFLLFYSFFFGPGSPVYSPTSSRGFFAHPSAHNPSYIPAGWGGDALKNRIFFTLMFVEMVSWFWAWLTIREERDVLIAKMQRRRDID
jgi:hypothetical protein